MANYCCTSRTNYFTVTDEEKYKELFSNLISEDNIEDFTTETDGKISHGFGSYGVIDYCPDEDEDECNFDYFLNELQKILPDNEAFMLFEAGNEKLRFVSGSVCIVTNKDIKFFTLRDVALEAARAMLNNNDFDTITDY